MRQVSVSTAVLIALIGYGLLCGLAGSAVAADEPRNLFEWCAVAPLVIAGTSLGEDGRYVDFKVSRSVRGDLQPGSRLKIDVKYANRNRDRMLHPKSLRLDRNVDYVLLLEEQTPRDPEDPPFYRIARGVLGARELPLEGREAYLDALGKFVAIQDTDSEELAWHLLSGLLEESNPILLETALEQFIKFHRGDPDLTMGLIPLLDHPQAEIRVETARLIGQIIERYWGEQPFPDDQSLRAELIARATSDDSIPVRVAAVEALSGYPPNLIGEVLDQIADSDPEQQVRYTAELILLEHKQAGSNSSGPKR